MDWQTGLKLRCLGRPVQARRLDVQPSAALFLSASLHQPASLKWSETAQSDEVGENIDRPLLSVQLLRRESGP